VTSYPYPPYDAEVESYPPPASYPYPPYDANSYIRCTAAAGSLIESHPTAGRTTSPKPGRGRDRTLGVDNPRMAAAAEDTAQRRCRLNRQVQTRSQRGSGSNPRQDPSDSHSLLCQLAFGSLKARLCARIVQNETANSLALTAQSGTITCAH
jgi:hypothetical protein